MAARQLLQLVTAALEELAASSNASSDLASAAHQSLLRRVEDLLPTTTHPHQQLTTFSPELRAFMAAVLTALQGLAKDHHTYDQHWLTTLAVVLISWAMVTTLLCGDSNIDGRCRAWLGHQGGWP
jgi:hypothetical protein